jgi:serine/threonine protein kinase
MVALAKYGEHPSSVGRYALFKEIAAGGMASVYLGRLLGTQGFTRTVAIKRLHPQFAKDPPFAARFVEEAQLAASIQHPNVVPTLDVVQEGGELFLVMEYVRGETLSQLLRKTRELPLDVTVGIMTGVLHGLHAAHEAVDHEQRPLGIVHRDVSPQNILVGVDGVARVLDFGIAKATTTSSVTQDGQLRGKLRYMSPEQCLGSAVDRRADIFAAGVVLWEALTGRELFSGDDPAVIIRRVLEETIPPPSSLVRSLAPEADAVVLRALDRARERRFQTAREMAIALEEALPAASPRRVGDFVAKVAQNDLSVRASLVAELESLDDQALERRLEASGGDATLPTIIGPPRSTTPLSTVAAPKRQKGSVSFAIVALLIVIAIVVSVGSMRKPVPTRASEPSLSEPISRPPPPVEPTIASALVVPTESSSRPSEPSHAHPRRPLAPAREAAPSKPTSAGAPDCTPPYTIDARGDKHYKRECL